MCLLGNANNSTGQATASVASLPTLLVVSFSQIISLLMDLMIKMGGRRDAKRERGQREQTGLCLCRENLSVVVFIRNKMLLKK